MSDKAPRTMPIGCETCVVTVQSDGTVAHEERCTIEMYREEQERLRAQLGDIALDGCNTAMAALARVREALEGHWITAMECDHVTETDIVRCSCSVWTGTSQPSVGAAVRQWIAHVFALASLGGTAVEEEK